MATKNLAALLTIGGAVKSSLGAAFRRTSSGLDDIGKQIRKAKTEQAKLAAEIARLSRNGPAQVGHLTTAYHALTQQLTQLNAQQQRLRANQQATQARMEKRGRMGVGMAAGAAATAAQGYMIGNVVRTSSEWNTAMLQMGVTAEATGQQVRQMGDYILRTARDTGQGAKEVRSAQGFLVAAGMELGTSQKMLLTIGRTATASSAEIEDVSKSVFTLNDALKVKPEGMQEALDILVKSGKLGNFEFKAMAKNLPSLGAAFVSLKMQGNEAAATMGAALQIARKGAGDEDEAANNLKNLLAKVMSPETLKKAAKKGVNLHAIISGAQKRGENPFEAAMEAINKLTKGGELKALGELFQDMQVQNAVKPLLQNWDDYKRIKREALAAKGTVDRDFERMAQTSTQALSSMSGAAFELSVRLGTALEPAIVALSNAVTPVLRGLADWANENPRLAATLTGLVVGATALTTGIFAIGFASTFIAPGLAALSTAFAVVRTAVVGLSAAMWANPVGLVVAGVAALAAGAYLVYKNWEPIKKFFGTVWDTLVEGAKKAFEWIVGKLGWIGDAFRRAKSWVTGTSNDAPPPLPEVPPMATAGAAAGGGRAGATTQNYNINVQAAPGQSPAQIAGAVAAKAGAQGGKLGALHDQPDW